jgi:pSer/pThr/pTyr-binding forkhead associated (FHA) protein
MAKFCNNGHEMDDDWTDCPYCVKPGHRLATGGALDKTRPDVSSPVPDARPAFDPGATVPISVFRKPPVVGWLVALNGPQKGDDFRLREGKNVLGTKPGSEITLRDQAVSAVHASINYKDGKFVITDLDSTNGTLLNDDPEPVSRVELKDNDVIRVGELSLKFKCL